MTYHRQFPGRCTALVSLAAGALVLGLAGCQPDTSGAPPAPSGITPAGSPARTAASSPTAGSPTTTPATSTSTPTSAKSSPPSSSTPPPRSSSSSKPTQTTPAANARAYLLTTSSLLGGGWVVDKSYAGEGQAAFSICQTRTLSSMGASSVAIAYYRHESPGVLRVGNYVGVFSSEKAAEQAYQQVRQHQRSCLSRLRGEFTDKKQWPAPQIKIAGAESSWTLMTYGPVPGGNGNYVFYDSQGVVRVGNKVSWLTEKQARQDYEGDSGQEPMAIMLRRSAARLAK